MQGKGFEHQFSHKKICISPVETKKAGLLIIKSFKIKIRI